MLFPQRLVIARQNNVAQKCTNVNPQSRFCAQMRICYFDLCILSSVQNGSLHLIQRSNVLFSAIHAMQDQLTSSNRVLVLSL